MKKGRSLTACAPFPGNNGLNPHMTICSESILVNQGVNRARAVTLFCRSWNCDICAPKRRASVIAQIIGGRPTKLMTLTTRRIDGQSPDREAKFLALSFRRFVRMLRETWGKQGIHYFVVFEAHKSGWPHMHVALRAPYMPWWYLSGLWEAVTGSPGVDIRAIPRRGRIASYVAKYLGKEVGKFGTCKRYWKSPAWSLEQLPEQDQDGNWSDIWEPREMTRRKLAEMWESMGWLVWEEDRMLYGGLDPPAGARVVPASEVWG